MKFQVCSVAYSFLNYNNNIKPICWKTLGITYSLNPVFPNVSFSQLLRILLL